MHVDGISWGRVLSEQTTSIWDVTKELAFESFDQWNHQGQRPSLWGLFLYPLNLADFLPSLPLRRSLIPLSWSGCTCCHTTLHTPLMGVNCNWICCCLCQQFPFGSVAVAVITPCANRHVTIHTNPCYYSLSLFFFWDMQWCQTESTQFTISTSLWRSHCLSCLLG